MALKTDFKDDVLDTSVNTVRKYNMITNDDGTVSLEDATTYLQNGDEFGAQEINATNARVEECFQSVSDGKALLASAITDKRVNTDATATFAQMAANIDAITLGSGNAQKSHVLTPYTFTNDDGVEYTGEMIDQAGLTVDAGAVTNDATYTYLAVPANGYYSTASKVRTKNSNVMSKLKTVTVTTKLTSTETGTYSRSVTVSGITTIVGIKSVSNAGKAGSTSAKYANSWSFSGNVISFQEKNTNDADYNSDTVSITVVGY